MADDTRGRRLGHERCATRQQRRDGFAAAGCAALERRTPRVDRGTRNLLPDQPFPRAEVQLDQTCIDPVMPAPARQPTPDIRTALQWRRDDDARQPEATRATTDAMREALGLAAIYRHVGAPDAQPLDRDRPRVPPDDQPGHCEAANQPSSTSSSVTCWVAPSASPV